LTPKRPQQTLATQGFAKFANKSFAKSVVAWFPSGLMRISSASDFSMLASMALAIGAGSAMSAAAMTSRTYATVSAARYTRWFAKPQAVKHFNKRTARHLTKVPM